MGEFAASELSGALSTFPVVTFKGCAASLPVISNTYSGIRVGGGFLLITWSLFNQG